jgi:hypothetical protein
MDDLTREELLNVHLMREVNLILGSLMPKSKTQKARRSSPRAAVKLGFFSRRDFMRDTSLSQT